jgi:hypothetical protein
MRKTTAVLGIICGVLAAAALGWAFSQGWLSRTPKSPVSPPVPVRRPRPVPVRPPVRQEPEAPPVLLKVLFDRETPPEILKQYEITGGIVYVEQDPSDEWLERKLREWDKNKDLVKVVLNQDPRSGRKFIQSTVLGESLARKAEKAKWRTYALKNWAIGKPMAGCSYEGSVASLQKCTFSRYAANSDVRILFEHFRDKTDRPLSAIICRTDRPATLQHDFLRNLVKMDISAGKSGAHRVLRAKPIRGHSRQHCVAWLHGDDIAVYIYGLTPLHDALVKLYLDKFPSSLPEAVNLSKTDWAKAELEAALAGMKVASAMLPQDAARERIHRCLLVRAYARIPMLKGAEQDTALPTLQRKQIRTLSDWWKQHKERAKWSVDAQQLVADVETSAGETEDESRRGFELTPQVEAELKALLMKMFEAELKAQVARNMKTFGAKSGAMLTKVEDGKWCQRLRLSPTGPPTSFTATGPLLSALPKGDSRAARYPVVGVFKRTYFDKELDREAVTTETYYYDRVKQRWTRAVK